MGTPISKVQRTALDMDREYAKSKDASYPKEITNKKGQVVILYNRGAEMFANAFDQKTGAEIKHTIFSPDGSHYTNEKTATGSVMSFGSKNHIDSKMFCDEKGAVQYSVHYNAQGKPDAVDYKK